MTLDEHIEQLMQLRAIHGGAIETVSAGMHMRPPCLAVMEPLWEFDYEPEKTGEKYVLVIS